MLSYILLLLLPYGRLSRPYKEVPGIGIDYPMPGWFLSLRKFWAEYLSHYGQLMVTLEVA